MAGGGKVKGALDKLKKFSRRDVLKGIGATAATAAAGMKAGTKVTDPGAALKQIDEALSTPAVKAAWSKQDMTPRQWATIDKYLLDKFDDLEEMVNEFHDPTAARKWSQEDLLDMQNLENELDQIEHIRGADPEYVFDPSAQEYLEEFVQDTVNDLNLEIHDYGDFDDINDPRVTHVREMDRLITPTRESLEVTDPRGERTMGGLGPREKYAGGGAIKASLKRWRVWDMHDKKFVSAPYSNKKRARSRVDKLDNEYGAYRYTVKEVEEAVEKAGGGKIRGALRSLKEGPGAYEAAMAAAKAGDTESALNYLRQLQELLQLSDEDFSKMIGQGIDREPQVKFNPPVDPDLDTPIGGYKEQRGPGSPMRKAAGGKIKGSLIKANEWFARKAGKRLNEGLDIPKGFESFYTQKQGNHTSIIGVRKDGTEQNVGNIVSLHPGDDTEKIAKELASAYNTGGFSEQAINPIPLKDVFGIGEGEPTKADIASIGPRPPSGGRLRSFQEHLENLMTKGDPDEFELADMALYSEDALNEADYETLLVDLYDAGLTPKFYREFAEQNKGGVPTNPDITVKRGFDDPDTLKHVKKILDEALSQGDDISGDMGELDLGKLMKMLEDNSPEKFAEGGVVKKSNKALEYLRAVGRSLAGAIPGTSESFHEMGEEIGSQIYRKGALPVSGFKSQWYGVDPDTGEFVYAGPFSGDDSPGSDAIPGIIDETMLLPSLPRMIEELYDYKKGKFEDPDYEGPAIGAPQFSLDAAERANVNWDESLRSMGIDPETEGPKGFVENALISGGMMLGQLPVPISWFGRARNLLPATKAGRIDRVIRQLANEAGDKPGMLRQIAGSGPEFLFPTIDPKTSNYIAGSLFGGTLMTALDPGEIEEVEQTMDPEIAQLISQYQNGTPEEREEARKILQAILDANTAEPEEDRLNSINRQLDQMGQSGVFAGGGKIRKFSRRDILKGIGAAGVTGAAAGKAGMKGADLPPLQQIEEVLEAAPVAVKKAVPKATTGTPWLKVAERLRKEYDEHWRADNDAGDMAEMYAGDIDDYEYIATAMEDNRIPDAIKRYDSLDTSSREMIYDVDPDTTIALRRQLGKGGSDWERLEWDDLDVGEQELILDDLQRAYEDGGQTLYDRTASRVIEDYGVDVDGEDLSEYFDFIDVSEGFAGGGKIRKLNRRDVLKGIGAVGVTGLAGGKAGVKTGALDQIDEALSHAAPKVVRTVADRLVEAPTATFAPGNLNKNLRSLLSKVVEDTLDHAESIPRAKRVQFYSEQEYHDLLSMGDAFQAEFYAPLDKSQMQSLENALEFAMDEVDDVEGAKIKKLLDKLRNSPALDNETFFKQYAESAWDRPSAGFEYQERLGIPAEDQIELPMRGELYDVMDEVDLRKLEKMFGEDGIPEELLYPGWDT